MGGEFGLIGGDEFDRIAVIGIGDSIQKGLVLLVRL
jgi:hypothetical protein